MYKDVFMALFQFKIFKPKIKSRQIFTLIMVCCIIAHTDTNAQSFSFKAALPTVDSPAFYKIKLSPFIITKSGYGLRDIRILDEKRNETPYVIKHRLSNDLLRLPEPIISSKDTTGKNSYYIVHFTDSYEVDKLQL